MTLPVPNTPSPAPFISVKDTFAKDLQIIRDHGLLTKEGREAFLTNQLKPLVGQISQLNEEIQELTSKIQSLTEQQMILESSQLLTQKMDFMSSLLPIMGASLKVDSDFKFLDLISTKDGSLDPQEQEVVTRLVFLCQSVNLLSSLR